MKKLLIIPALLLLTAGCDRPKNERIENGFDIQYDVDTLMISNHPHEFVILKSQGNYGTTIMHSPECWCGKQGKEETK